MQARSRLAMSWVLFPAAIVFVVALVFALKAVL